MTQRFVTYVQELDGESGILIKEWAVVNPGHPSDNPDLDDMLGSYGVMTYDQRNPSGYGLAYLRNRTTGKSYNIWWLLEEKFYAEYYRPEIPVSVEGGDVTEEFRTEGDGTTGFLFTLPNAENMVCETFRTDKGWGARVYAQSGGEGFALSDGDDYDHQSDAIGSAMSNAFGHYFGSEEADKGEPDEDERVFSFTHAEWRDMASTLRTQGQTALADRIDQAVTDSDNKYYTLISFPDTAEARAFYTLRGWVWNEPEDAGIAEYVIHSVAEWKTIFQTLEKAYRPGNLAAQNAKVLICNGIVAEVGESPDAHPNAHVTIGFPDAEADVIRDAWSRWVHANTP